MSIPALSMRIFAEQELQNAKARRRSEAAKKAWQTRRRMAKPSDAQVKVLQWLADPRGELRVKRGFGVRVRGAYVGLQRLRVTYATYKAILARKWIKKVREQHEGTTTFHLGAAEQITYEDVVMIFHISDKGRKVLERP